MAFKITLKDYDGKQFLAAGIILLAIGIFSAIFGFAQINNFNEMKQWPVIKAEITQTYENYSDENSKHIEDYTIHVSYSVDGGSFARVFTTKQIPAQIEVAYSPSNPSEAYLASDMPESDDFYWLGVIAGIIGIPVFIFAFEVEKTQKRKKKHNSP